MFDRVTVAIAKNPRKTPLFSVKERLEILARHTREFENVEVTSFDDHVIVAEFEVWSGHGPTLDSSWLLARGH